MVKRLNLGPEIERYTQIIARDPDSLAFVPLADAYRKSGLYEEAFAVLKRGLAGRGNYLPARIVLGKCYLDLGNYPKAESTFRSVLRTDPDNLVALDCVALMRKRQRRLGEAATVYRRILELDPSNSAAREKLEKLEGQPHGAEEDVIELDLDAPVAEGTEETEDEEEEYYQARTREETTDTPVIDFARVMQGDEDREKRDNNKDHPDDDSIGDAVVGSDNGSVGETDEQLSKREEIDLRDTERELELATDELLPEPIEPERNNEIVDIEAEFGVMPENVTETKGEKTAESKDNEERRRDVDVDVAAAFAEEDYQPPVSEKVDGDEDETVEDESPDEVVTDSEEPEVPDKPVPPPPTDDELPIEEPRTEVMEDEDIPPVQPPVKEDLPPSREKPIVPNLGAFTDWLSDIAERKKSQDDKESDSGN